MNRLMLLLFISVTPFLGLNAQELDRATTVDYLNAKSDPACELFFEKKNIRIEFYANGEPVRIDYIFPETIDWEKGIYYSESESAVIFSCYEKAGKQIEREILKHGSKLLYDRSNYKVSCSGDECQALVTAAQHLIRLYVDKDYSRDQPFEEN